MNRFYFALLFGLFLQNTSHSQFDNLQFPYFAEELINDTWQLSKEFTLKFNGSDAWFGDDQSRSWISQENYELRNCIDLEGKLIAFTSFRNESTARMLSWTGETKNINGYDCEQLIVQWSEMKMEAWVSRDTKQSYIPYIAQPGVTLEYTLFTDKFTKRFISKAGQPLDHSALPKASIDLYEKMDYQGFSNFMTQKFMPKSTGNATPFSGTTMDGELLNYEGKSDGLLLINFWYTQCPPCIKEIPALNELKKKYAEAAIDFWAITFDEEKLVSSFLKNHPFDFQILPNAKEIINSFAVQAYPTSILIDANGKIIKSLLGGDKNTLTELDTLIQQNLH